MDDNQFVKFKLKGYFGFFNQKERIENDVFLYRRFQSDTGEFHEINKKF